jgi:hypothetical protein
MEMRHHNTFNDIKILSHLSQFWETHDASSLHFKIAICLFRHDPRNLQLLYCEGSFYCTVFLMFSISVQ